MPLPPTLLPDDSPLEWPRPCDLDTAGEWCGHVTTPKDDSRAMWRVLESKWEHRPATKADLAIVRRYQIIRMS